MKPWLKLSLLIVFGIATQCLGSNPEVTVLREWEYKKGLHPNWLDSSPGEGKVVLPQNFWSLKEFGPSYQGWITLRHAIPNDLRKKLQKGVPIALNAGRVLDVSHYYFDGNLFGQLGSAEPYQEAAMRPFMKDIPFSVQSISENTDIENSSNKEERTFLKPENYLTIAVYTNGKYPAQLMDKVEIGPADQVYWRVTFTEVLNFALLSVYLASGLYHGLLFFRRPQDRYNLLFALFAILISLYWFVGYTITRDFVFGSAVELHRKTEHILMFLLPPLFALFIRDFFIIKNKFALVFGVYALLSAIITAVSPLWVMRYVRDVFQLIALPISFAYILYELFKQIRAKNREALFIVLGVILIAVGAANDVLESKGWVPTVRILNYTYLIFVVGLAGLMASRFMRVTNEVETLNRDLEQKVVDRTKDLQNTLEEVQTLKVQQDGDYYLTTLLVAPLAGNNSTSELVTVDMITEQKKKFTFKQNDFEIGGDVCIVDSIRLREQQYVVVLNADAMGKSIQGAGGAIVIGTVLRAILARAQNNKTNSPPEIWLRDAAVEMQGVLETFQCSMLVSCVLALIEERTGAVYYFNAEHPRVTLYRNRKASFLSEDGSIHKLGMPGWFKAFRIHFFQLQEGDALFIGSDGKDDFVVGEDQNGSRIINEDEKQFLGIVESANGDLKEVINRIRAKGELIDDLSIIRISAPGELFKQQPSDGTINLIRMAHNHVNAKEFDQAEKKFDAAFSLAPSAPRILSAVCKFFLKHKKFEKAKAAAESLLMVEGEEEALYLHSTAAKFLNEFDLALESSMRLRLRNPRHIKNLIQTADIYRLTDNDNLALEIIEEVLERQPSDETARKLFAILQNKRSKVSA